MFRAKRVFADCQVSMDEAFEEGDKVVVRWRLRGTWTQPIPGIVIKPTGKPIDLTGISVYHFKGDQVVDKYGQFDVGAFHAAACEQVRAQECVEALKALGSRA
jgi:predicted ester cyclase